jgi:hypothetical protein
VSKGDRNRSISEEYVNGYDKIKWSENSDPDRFSRKPRTRAKVHHIMPDIEPYKAMAGEDAKKGRWISSRSHEREYLKRNNCIQVGTEKDTFFKHNGKTEDNPTKGW